METSPERLVMLEILGLPAHILFLHAVVVLSPVAALTGLVYALRPSWGRILEGPAVVLAVLAAGFTLLTASAGEALQDALPSDPLIEAHAEQGGLLEVSAALFTGAVLVLVVMTGPWISRKTPFLTRLRHTRWLVITVRVLVVLAAVWMIYQVAVTGHSGAQAVWTNWRTS